MTTIKLNSMKIHTYLCSIVLKWWAILASELILADINISSGRDFCISLWITNIIIAHSNTIKFCKYYEMIYLNSLKMAKNTQNIFLVLASLYPNSVTSTINR